MSNVSNIDIDKLIKCVKCRPTLYSRNGRYETGHQQRKKRLWLEVCAELNPDFHKMSATQRQEYDSEVYKRWRSLRTCFTRELALQKKEKIEKTTKRRKIYENFDALRFLLVDCGEDASAYQDESIQILQFDSEEDTPEFEDLDESSRGEGTLQNIKSEVEIESYPESEVFFNTPNSVKETVRGSTRDTLDVSLRQESDSDKLFMLSLIPSFRRIPTKKKLAAKIALLKVMESFQED
ncbi:uncharacterized protein LOC112056052 [Bicyclus anynana]|uniref:Uncharacterized protein LOC112056052 n=1 Tax=Bicyclus anynana TaxID=110368 RepID=A0A6J1NX27_BICAN|nr:uncharacterized protein LOC112056052 [Bicyclus anynana]